MEVNNEIRRTKAKLKVLEQEASYWVLFDLIDGFEEGIDDKEKTKMVDHLKKGYLKYLKDNEIKKPKQTKLFKDEKISSKNKT